MLFEFDEQLERDAIADSLRTVADSLENGDPRTLEAGGESVPMSPPGQLTVEIKAEREPSSSALDGPGKLGLEFELEWADGADETDDGDLTTE